MATKKTVIVGDEQYIPVEKKSFYGGTVNLLERVGDRTLHLKVSDALALPVTTVKAGGVDGLLGQIDHYQLNVTGKQGPATLEIFQGPSHKTQLAVASYETGKSVAAVAKGTKGTPYAMIQLLGLDPATGALPAERSWEAVRTVAPGAALKPGTPVTYNGTEKPGTYNLGSEADVGSTAEMRERAVAPRKYGKQ